MSEDVTNIGSEFNEVQDLPAKEDAKKKPTYVFAKILFSADNKEDLVNYLNETALDPEGVIIRNPNIVRPKLSF